LVGTVSRSCRAGIPFLDVAFSHKLIEGIDHRPTRGDSLASDIDLLMVVDDPADPGVTELTRMLDEATERLGRSVNVRSYGSAEFERKCEGPFLSRVLAQPLIALKGEL